jgi:hypothetical protein
MFLYCSHVSLIALNVATSAIAGMARGRIPRLISVGWGEQRRSLRMQCKKGIESAWPERPVGFICTLSLQLSRIPRYGTPFHNSHTASVNRLEVRPPRPVLPTSSSGPDNRNVRHAPRELGSFGRNRSPALPVRPNSFCSVFGVYQPTSRQIVPV